MSACSYLDPHEIILLVHTKESTVHYAYGHVVVEHSLDELARVFCQS